MKTLEDQLSMYGQYHKDKRNIATHFIGIPLIVVAIIVLLSRPSLSIGGLSLTPAFVISLLSVFYYVCLSKSLGFIMAVLFALSIWFGSWVANLETSLWLAIGLGGFVVGWIFQFIGHLFEGRKPAFFDDISGLIIGPLFVVTEAAFLMGFYPKLKSQIQAHSQKVY